MNKQDDIITIRGRHYHAATGKPVDGQPQEAARPHTSGNQQLKHLAPHSPEHARTLMRQAVKKPQAGLKRRIKVQGHLSGPAKPATNTLLTRSAARRPHTERLQHPAIKRPKGQLISHFSPNLFVVEAHTPAAAYGNAAVKHAAAPRAPQPAAASKSLTTSELLDYAVKMANVPSEPLPRQHQRKLFKRHAAV